MSARVDNPGNDGAVSQNNSSEANSAAAVSGSGAGTQNPSAPGGSANATTGDAPAVAQANAKAQQSDPTNFSASVRVNSQGNGGALSQNNSAAASSVAGAGGASNAGVAPTAQATQDAPRNVSVVVRVASPGDEGAVSQANTAAAAAAAVPPGTIATGVSVPGSSLTNVNNTATIGQSVEQCPATCDGNAGTPVPLAAAAASGGGLVNRSAVAATQLAPTNTHVVVRIGSPGSDGAVSQSSTATADGATSVATRTDADNLDLSVIIPGSAEIFGPSGSAPWIWAWTWGAAAAPTGAEPAPTSSTTWNWGWSAAPAASIPAARPGHWIWTWVWTRGDGWATNFTFDQPCSCSWVWAWNWTWGAPAGVATNTGLPWAPVTAPQISQTNSTTATAVASTAFSAASAAAPAGAGDDAASVVSVQQATASAVAGQARPENVVVISAGVLDSLTQVNEATATAAARAEFDVFQGVARAAIAEDDGALHQTSVDQTIVNAQTVEASATSVQVRPFNVTAIWSPTSTAAPILAIQQENVATSAAVARATGAATQTASQALIPAGLDQTAEIAQSISSSQTAIASATAAQTSVGNVAAVAIPERGILNPALSQSNKISAGAGSFAKTSIGQDALQVAAGKNIEWHEVATQTATVKQGGVAEDRVSLGDRVNTSGWRGAIAPLLVPSLPAPSPSANQPVGGASDSVGTSSSERSLTSAFPTRGGLVLLRARAPHAKVKKVKLPRQAAVPREPQRAYPHARPSPLGESTRVHPLLRRPLRGNGSTSTSLRSRTTLTSGPSLSSQRAPTLMVGAAVSETNARGGMRPSAGATRRAPSPQGPGCAWCPDGSSLTGWTSGASGHGFAGVVAALTTRFKFAAPGAGWPHVSAPALGRPVDTAPIERPG